MLSRDLVPCHGAIVVGRVVDMSSMRHGWVYGWLVAVACVAMMAGGCSEDAGGTTTGMATASRADGWHRRDRRHGRDRRHRSERWRRCHGRHGWRRWRGDHDAHQHGIQRRRHDPQIYECASGGGNDESPPLAWTAGPAGTQSYAIVMRDLDNNNLIHWIIWDIPASAMALPQGIVDGFDVVDPAGATKRGARAAIVTSDPVRPLR